MIKDLLSLCEDLTFDDLPADVVSQAKMCLLDWLGVTLAGMSHPTASILLETIQQLGGNQQASVLGSPIKTSVYNAALVNGTASHVLDFDDTLLSALMHPSVNVLPAVLACGEWRNADGRQFLLSYLIGFEVEARISMAMGAAHYDAGWHSTATMGRFGAAAAVAKMFGLSGKQTANALGLAGTQSAGLRKVFGTMGKSFHPGKAAADGLFCALLAEHDFTCSEDILSGEKGLGAVFSTDFNPQRGLRGLGQSYTIMDISIKPFASCLYTHPTIDGIIHLRNRHEIQPDQVKRIRCRVSKFCSDAACQTNPETGLAGKFSTYYCAALALVKGKAGEHEFNDECLGDAEIHSIMDRVSVDMATGLTDSEAEVSIELNDGRVLEHTVRFPLGSPANPLSAARIQQKFRDLVDPILSRESIDLLLDKVERFESIPEVAELPLLMA